ncbi:MAG: hypothetical protein WKF37_19330, partial [Bryobacteraceae bacterium]
VRNYWLSVLPGDKEKAWRKALHDGLIASTPVGSSPAPAFTGSPAPAAASGYEVVFVPSWSLWDGRFANNRWMQEAPDPMTKLTWDNAALLSPATAKKLSVVQGDVISIERGANGLTLRPSYSQAKLTIRSQSLLAMAVSGWGVSARVPVSTPTRFEPATASALARIQRKQDRGPLPFGDHAGTSPDGRAQAGRLPGIGDTPAGSRRHTG